jgi:hypothetical protein
MTEIKITAINLSEYFAELQRAVFHQISSTIQTWVRKRAEPTTMAKRFVPP